MWVDTSTSIGSHQSPLIACFTKPYSTTLFRRLTGGGGGGGGGQPLPPPRSHRLPGQKVMHHAQVVWSRPLTWHVARTLVLPVAGEASRSPLHALLQLCPVAGGRGQICSRVYTHRGGRKEQDSGQRASKQAGRQAGKRERERERAPRRPGSVRKNVISRCWVTRTAGCQRANIKRRRGFSFFFGGDRRRHTLSCRHCACRLARP